MLRAKPGAYVFIGNGDGSHRAAGHGLGPCMLHNSAFDFNDELIPLGATYWVRLAEKLLASYRRYRVVRLPLQKIRPRCPGAQPGQPVYRGGCTT